MSDSKLPSGWSPVKFGDVVRNVNETSRNLAADGLDRVVGLDHLDPGSLRLMRWDSVADLPDGTTFTRKFKPGQVLFGKRRAYQRKVAVPHFSGVCSGDILVFEPVDKRMTTEFLPYVVQSDGFFDHALGTSAGSLSPRTKWAELARYEFALPPIDKQQRISSLMQAFESAAHLARSLPTDLVRRAAITEFVNYWRLQTGTVKLSEVCEIYQPKTISAAEMHDSGAFPVFGANGQIGRYGKFNHVESEVAVTCRGATCGTVNMTPPMAWITGNSMVVRPRDSAIRRDYLFAILKHGTDLAPTISGTAQPQITRRSLSPIEIVVPASVEQDVLCKQLNEIDKIDRFAKEIDISLMSGRRALLNEMLRSDEDVY